jgi:hypothetical protein
LNITAFLVSWFFCFIGNIEIIVFSDTWIFIFALGLFQIKFTFKCWLNSFLFDFGLSILNSWLINRSSRTWTKIHKFF